MSLVSSAIDHATSGLHHEAQQLIDQLPGEIRPGVQAAVNEIAKLGARSGVPGLRGGTKRGAPPRPKDPAYTCGINHDGSPRAGRRTFPFIFKATLTGGVVQAVNTSLAQFFLNANCAQMTTDKKFPNNAKTDSLKCVISARLANLFTEDDAALASLFIVESHAGAEVARYPLMDLYPQIGRAGSDGTGTGVSINKYDAEGVAFEQTWDPNTEYQYDLQTSKPFTPVSDINIAMVFSGTIGAQKPQS